MPSPSLRSPARAGCSALLAAACLAAAGCVERTIEVRSDPPGASVFIDRVHKGEAPVVVPFHHYGTREIAVEKPGFRAQTRVEALWPPWFQIFPLDFVFDCLWPFTLRDRRTFEFRLEKADSAPEEDPEAARRELLERAERLRKEAGR